MLHTFKDVLDEEQQGMFGARQHQLRSTDDYDYTNYHTIDEVSLLPRSSHAMVSSGDTTMTGAPGDAPCGTQPPPAGEKTLITPDGK